MEQLPDGPFGLSNPLAEQFGALHGEEVELRLRRERSRNQRLAAAWRTVEQDPGRWLYTQTFEDFRMLVGPNNCLNCTR